MKHLLYLFLLNVIICQTTGKISGTIIDGKSNEPIIGANVLIKDSYLGTASDISGDFYILNLNPGKYSVEFSVIGYETKLVQDVRVSVNRTTPLNIELNQTAIEGATVYVTADQLSIKKDQTSTVKNISSDQIDILPVESVGAIINMQSGVVDGHFRGGRNTEVTYLIDGMRVDEGFGGASASVEIEPETLSDLEIITGTFNAEYGKAMSGVVNQITKDGDNFFEGNFSINQSNYLTQNNNIFPGITNFDLNLNQDYKFQISGPIIKDVLTFFTNLRSQDNLNHLNGYHYFNVADSSDFSQDNSNDWYSEHSGTNNIVPMNYSINNSLFLKLTFKPLSKFKISFIASDNNDEWHSYDHAYKYNPYGMNYESRKSKFYALQSNIMLNKSSFLESKLSMINNIYGNYVYENPLDNQYVANWFHTNTPGFYTGGQGKSHTNREMINLNLKTDWNWQINKNHTFKTGFEFVKHEINNNRFQIEPHPDSTNYYPYIYDNVISPLSDVYTVEPFEGSFYLQDKMEFDEMVVNLGLRYDHFDPNTYYPSDYRNPANELSNVSQSEYLKAKVQTNISPRFGLAYQIANEAVLHFSYGHFFQIPPMYAMYENPNWIIPTTDFGTILGNPNLEAEKTITYELGLWQKLNSAIGFEVNLYYRDIYNLLGTKTLSTYNSTKFGLYSNKDYGNVRGIEIKADSNYGNFSTFLNYTLQYTRGIADSPTQAFSREGQNLDPVNRLIPMSWDQRHTFNITFSYNEENFGISSTTYFNSGTTYTFEPLSGSQLAQVNLLPNNDYKPFNYNIDLTGYYAFKIGSNQLRATFSIYNLTDRLNQLWVNSKTGRAYTDILTSSQIAGYRSNFSEIEETYQNPSMYSAPRSIKLGLEIVLK
tara:strand:- start:1481 stop:4117 length:2637 start_codon:yes stop_codon:yes gene_type:complete